MAIQNSLEWNKESTKLLNHINSIGYNPDLQRIHHNIGLMVDELSKLEVEVRRTHKTYITEEKIAEINSAIDRLEKLILLGKLLY